MSNDKSNNPEKQARITSERLQTLRDDELLDLIRETVEQLNRLGDRLELYAERGVTSPKPEE